MIRGINHVTLAVRDLDASLGFYADVLGARPRARWARGAYLELGALWLCLELDPRAGARPDDSHVAFAVSEDDLASLEAAIDASGARRWKENRSEGASVYFEDPDGHKLEIHAGDIGTRLASCRARPYEGMVFFERDERSSDAPALRRR